MAQGEFRIGYDHTDDILTIISDTAEEGVYHPVGDRIDVKLNRKGQVVGVVIYNFVGQSTQSGKDFRLSVPIDLPKPVQQQTPKKARTPRRSKAAA